MKTTKKQRPRILLINRCLVKNDQNKILLIKRTANDPWEAGKWELPGGKIDVGQDVSNAMEREVLEETGLYVKVASGATFTESFILNSGKYKGLPYVLIVYVGSVIGGSVVLSNEHSEYRWVTKEEGLTLDTTVETKKAILTLAS